MRDKLTQALAVIRRLQARERSWTDTARNLSLLISENIDAVKERDEMARSPVGYIHGIMERIRQEIGPDAQIELRIDQKRKLFCRIDTPNGSTLMDFAADDYDANADTLAIAVRGVCERKGIIQPCQ